MSSLKLRAGTPLPYTLTVLKGEDGRFTRHAVIECCDCKKTEALAWVKQENPTLICLGFERKGWVIYQTKVRCPDCAKKRKQQQAAFARIHENEKEAMNNTPRPTLHPVPPPTSEPGERKVFILIIDEHGHATITPAHDTQEMLFGNQTYLVIPQIV
jgi:hypothetical protein